MLGKIRIYELAQDLGLTNKVVMDDLREMGISFATHSSTIDQTEADQIRRKHSPKTDEPPAKAPKESKSAAKPAGKTKEATAAKAAASVKVATKEEPPKKVPVKKEPAKAKTAKSAETVVAVPAPPAALVAPAPKKSGVKKKETPVAASPVAVPAKPAPAPAKVIEAKPPAAKPLSAKPPAPIAPKAVPTSVKAQPSKAVAPAPAVKPTQPAPIKKPAPPVAPPKTAVSAPAPKPAVSAPAPKTPAPAAQAATAVAPAPRPVAPPPPPPPPAKPVVEPKLLYIPEGATVKELAERMNLKSKDLLGALMRKGIFAHINQTLETAVVSKLAEEFNFLVETLSYEDMTARQQGEAAEASVEKAVLVPRAPIVTVMGHVDHGKTKLLDAIRQTNVALQEAGGITQHIGAYHVTTRNPKDGTERTVVFLDTPGHEAFTRMRARGASVTDIVVLVVAADDGVKPQTDEAISHARAAGVPIVVAVNKIDKPGADLQRVRSQLAERNLIPEEWGGDTVMVNVSALKKQGIDELLEMLALVADMKELKGNPAAPARGAVLEAHIDRRHGQVATVLIQEGTLHVGDAFLAGSAYGRVRAILDDRGAFIEKAGPSTPIEVLGMNGLPEAGDRFQVVEDEKEARRVANLRQERDRTAKLVRERLTLGTLSAHIAKGDVQELPIILKCDVSGSLEVLAERLQALGTEKIKVRLIHRAIGAISEGDIILAEATGAIILGFHVRPETKAADLAQRQDVEVRTFDVIYELTEAVENAMLGLMKPIRKEIVLGRAEVRQVFKISGVGAIAGCHVASGSILRSADVKVLRQNVVVYEGKLASLKRFKDDAREVQTGFECGIGVANFNDLKVGDTIEAVREEFTQPQKLQ